MDHETRELERRLLANPRDLEAGRRLAAIDRRTGWTFHGRTPEEWGGLVLEGEPEEVERALGILRRLGPRACDQLDAVAPLIEKNAGALRFAALETAGAMADPRAYPSLLKALRSRRDEVQGAAAAAIGAIGDSSILPELEARLEDGYRRARGALLALAHLGGEPARRALEAAFKQRDPLLRITALEAGGILGDAAFLPQLRAGFESGDQEVAIVALTRVAGEAMLPELLTLLRKKDWAARGLAIKALAVLPRPEAALPLAGLLRLAHSSNGAILRVLATIGDARAAPAVADEVRHASRQTRADAVRCLGALDAAGHDALLREALRDPEPEVRVAAAEALVGAEAAGDLAAALDDSLGAVREAAARALVRIEAFDALIGGLEERGYWAVGVAVQALVELGSRGIQTLQRLLAVGSSDARRAALVGLTELGAREAVPAIRGLLVDQQASVRVAAVRALSRLAGAEAAADFFAAAEDPAREVALAGIDALALHRVPEAALFLEQRLENDALAAAAARGLGLLGSRGSIPALTRSFERPLLREAVLEALGRFADPATLPLFEKALDHPGARLRLAAVEALRGFSGEAATPVLIKAADPRQSIDVITCAIEQLRDRGDARAIDVLLDLLVDYNRNRRDAAEALGGIGKRCGVSALVKAFPARPDRPFTKGQFVALSKLEGHDVEARLMKALGAGDARLRKLAAGTLASVGTTRSAPALRAALETETHAATRAAMERALKKLG